MENAFSGYFRAHGQRPPRHLRYHVVGAYRIRGIKRRSPEGRSFDGGGGDSLPHSVEQMTFWGERKHAHGRRTAISDLRQPSLPVSVFAKERGGGPGYAQHRRGEAGGHPHAKESRTSLGTDVAHHATFRHARWGRWDDALFPGDVRAGVGTFRRLVHDFPVIQVR